MKHVSCLSVLALSGVLFAADPEVDTVSFSQDGVSRLVTVTYSLKDPTVPAITTFDVVTNGVSVGSKNLWAAEGDVNRVIPRGRTSYSFTWRPDACGALLADAVVKVSAWSLSAPPDYLIVDLTHGTNLMFAACEDAVPGGLFDDFNYRFMRLVMRKVHAPVGGQWRMGSAEPGVADNEAPHIVGLSDDYYVGVFEMTQGQYTLLKGSNPSSFTKEWTGRPVEKISYAIVRGGDGANLWPNPPLATSVLGLLRGRTGLLFDLPSEMQWEYACRAGNGDGKWGNGKAYDQTGDFDAAIPGRYRYNGGGQGSDYKVTDNTNSYSTVHRTATVGTNGTNAWGLCDMHGNVWEFCLDWYEEDITDRGGAVNVDTENPALTLSGASGSTRVCRGGCWAESASGCRSSVRSFVDPAKVNGNVNINGRYGFRVVAPAIIPAFE